MTAFLLSDNDGDFTEPAAGMHIVSKYATVSKGQHTSRLFQLVLFTFCFTDFVKSLYQLTYKTSVRIISHTCNGNHNPLSKTGYIVRVLEMTVLEVIALFVCLAFGIQ